MHMETFQVVAKCVLVPEKSVLLRVWDGSQPHWYSSLLLQSLMLRLNIIWLFSWFYYASDCSSSELYREDLVADSLRGKVVANWKLMEMAKDFMVDVWIFDNHVANTINIKVMKTMIFIYLFLLISFSIIWNAFCLAISLSILHDKSNVIVAG